MAGVQFDNNQTVAVTCHFAEGSQALGCHVQLNFSNDTRSQTISREDGSLTSCTVLEVNAGCFSAYCYQSQLSVYDWEADGTVGTLPIHTEMMFSERASEACAATTPSNQDG